jgi:hypothetical protein
MVEGDSVKELLTEKDKQAIYRRNRKNGYGISKKQLAAYGGIHRKARAENDARKMEYVEYLLTDINFHSECSMLSRGDYDEFFKSLKNW